MISATVAPHPPITPAERHWLTNRVDDTMREVVAEGCGLTEVEIDLSETNDGYKRAPAPESVPIHLSSFMLDVARATGRSPNPVYERHAEIQGMLERHAEDRLRRLRAARAPLATVAPGSKRVARERALSQEAPRSTRRSARPQPLPARPVVIGQGADPVANESYGTEQFRSQRAIDRYAAKVRVVRPTDHDRVDLRREKQGPVVERCLLHGIPRSDRGRSLAAVERDAIKVWADLRGLTTAYLRKVDIGGHGFQRRRFDECELAAERWADSRDLSLRDLRVRHGVGVSDPLKDSRADLAVHLVVAEGFCTDDVARVLDRHIRQVQRYVGAFRVVVEREPSDWSVPNWARSLADIRHSISVVAGGDAAPMPSAWWAPRYTSMTQALHEMGEAALLRQRALASAFRAREGGVPSSL